MAKSRTPEGQTEKLRWEAYNLYRRLSQEKKDWIRTLCGGMPRQGDYAKYARDGGFIRLETLERQAHRRWSRRSGPQYEYGRWQTTREATQQCQAEAEATV